MSTHTVPTPNPEPSDADRVDHVDVPLFDGYDDPPPPPSRDPDLSAGQRLTARQLENVRAGIHPLTRGRLHPEASTDATRTDPKGLPFTCGTCQFRDAHGYAKCLLEVDGRRVYVTHGPATDVRAWWPACESYRAVS